MKQGIDPTTHKPLSTDNNNNTMEAIDKKNCRDEKDSLPQYDHHHDDQSNTLASNHGPTFLVSDSGYYDGSANGVVLLTEACSKDHQSNLIKPPSSNFDSSLSIFDQFTMSSSTIEPAVVSGCGGYSSDLVSQFHNSNSIRPSFNQNNNFSFSSSMPSLASSGADFSDNSASRVSSYFMNEVKETSSNSSNVSNYAGFPMNNNIVENGAFSTWDVENKLESLIFQQFHHQHHHHHHHNQVNGIIKSEELMTRPSSWQESAQLHVQSSVDFGNYPLTSLSEDLTGANFDVFPQI